jgi:hypothetical protein
VIARVFVLLAAVSTGCRQPAPPPPPVVEAPAPELPPEPPWPGTLAAVLRAVESGRFATADSILAAFEESEAGTSAASESAFWRALLQTDPRNPAFSPATAHAALHAYLASPYPSRATEAGVLLRLLAISDSLRAAHSSARASAEQRDRAREEELQRLRDELQKTQAELDRIKRRLGSPKP